MTKMMLSTLAAVMILTSQAAMATPGDVPCTGTVGGKLALDVLIGYDNHESGASLIQVTARGEVIFSSTSVKSQLISSGTVLIAQSNGSEVGILVEGIDDETGEAKAVMDIAIAGGLKANAVELTCEM